MKRWSVVFDADSVQELSECLNNGPIYLINGLELRKLEEAVIDQIGGLRISIYANEPPPPHFQVSYNGETNDFAIKDCTPIHGNNLKEYFRNIRKWHKKNKLKLIEFWNRFRPTDCPVGEYQE